MTLEEQDDFDIDFCNKILIGRKHPNEYSKLLLTFGEIFLKKKSDRSMSLWRVIAGGEKVSSLITINMEAMMRTIVFIGCSKDWPNYLNSKEYLEWKKYISKNKTRSGSTESEFQYSDDVDNNHVMENYCQQDSSSSDEQKGTNCGDVRKKQHRKYINSKDNKDERNNRDSDINSGDEEDKKMKAIDVIQHNNSDNDSLNNNYRVNEVNSKNVHNSEQQIFFQVNMRHTLKLTQI